MRLAAFLFVIPTLLSAETWTPAQSMKVQSIAEVIPSPDGKLVAWTQTRAVMDAEKSEALTHIFIANADGSHRRQLTRGEQSPNAPASSPDGTWTSFLSDRSSRRNPYRIPPH